ncbi:hypothetical protein V500_08192 [Pseudogymnoascus sp. VKM F-4518 (FW-2643)]|nr:hypothetical protein V500_08192 [Pseudogymnoascus sp. VKM F-4518 (FW-2643)]
MPLFFSKSALLGLVLSGAITVNALTCEGNADDGKVYTAADGNTYAIECFNDYFGGDVGSGTGYTFEECIAHCNTVAGCIDVSYSPQGGQCYWKDKLEPPQHADWVWTARKTSGLEDNRLSCVDNKSNNAIYTSVDGDTYAIECGTEYPGGDIASTNGVTFEQCIEACQGVSGCIDVSYGLGGGQCYMKSKLQTQVDAANIWTARKLTSGGTPVAEPLTCDAKKDDAVIYQGSNGGKYKVICGTDYEGGNSGGPLTGVSFEACMDACDSANDCVDVSFIAGTCYLKNQLMPAQVQPLVWTGLKVGPLSCEGGKDDGKTYTAPNGQAFQIQCFKDHFGGDMGAANVETFDQCLDACGSASGCVTVAYVYGSCYMKNQQNEAQDHDWVWGAVAIESPTSTTSILAGPTSTSILTCEEWVSDNSFFVTSHGKQYEILCGVDYEAGDMSLTTVMTFEGCLDICDSTEGCIDVTYVGKSCYLKNKLVGKPVKKDYVWNARYLGPGPSPTITSSMVTATPKACSFSGNNIDPVVNSDVDTSIVTNLDPKTRINLFYAQTGGTRAVTLDLTMIYPTVVLEETEFISGLTCTGTETTEVSIQFSNAVAHRIATLWPSEPFVLITSDVASGCNPSSSRGVYLVSAFTFTSSASGLTITAQASAEELNDVADTMTIKYGTIGGGAPTSTCASLIHPSSTTGSVQATITSFLPDGGSYLSPGAQEIYDYFKARVPYDADGNIVANIPSVLNVAVSVDAFDPDDAALQAALEDEFQDYGMTPPGDLFNQAKDALKEDTCTTHSRSFPTKRHVIPAWANLFQRRSSIGSVDDFYNKVLAKRADGWEIACSDAVGAAASIFGLGDVHEGVCAGKDLYDSRDAIKCLFTNCQTYYTTTIITYYYPPPSTLYSFEYSWRVTFPTLADRYLTATQAGSVKCVNCGLSVSNVGFTGEIMVNMTSGEIQKAVVTTGVSQVADLVMNLKSSGPYEGTYSYAVSSTDLGDITVDKIFTIVPKMLYGIGADYKTDFAVDINAGARMTLTNAEATIDILKDTVTASKNWQPAVSFTNPVFSSGSNVYLAPLIRTAINMKVQIFGITFSSTVLTSETVVGMESEYQFTKGSCPAGNLAVNSYVSSKNSLYFGYGVPKDLSTTRVPNKLMCLNVPSSQPSPAEMSELNLSGQEFCTSFVNYKAPTSAAWSTATVTSPAVTTATHTDYITNTPVINEYRSTTISVYRTNTFSASTSTVYTAGTASIGQKYLKKREGAEVTVAPDATTTSASAEITLAPEESSIAEQDPMISDLPSATFMPQHLWALPAASLAPGPAINSPEVFQSAVSNGTISLRRRHMAQARAQPQAAPAPAVVGRQAVATPAVVADWPATKISYACKQVATGTATKTYTATSTLISGLTTVTQTVTANVNGPLSTRTVMTTSTAYMGYVRTTVPGVATVTRGASCPLQTQATCFEVTAHGRPHVEGKKMRYYKDNGMFSFLDSSPGTVFYVTCDGTLTMLNQGSRLILANSKDQVTHGDYVRFVTTAYAEANPGIVEYGKCTKTPGSGQSASGLEVGELSCTLFGENTFTVRDPFIFVQSWYADPWWPEWQWYPAWGPAENPGDWPNYGTTVYYPIRLEYQDVVCPCDMVGDFEL